MLFQSSVTDNQSMDWKTTTGCGRPETLNLMVLHFKNWEAIRLETGDHKIRKLETIRLGTGDHKIRNCMETIRLETGDHTTGNWRPYDWKLETIPLLF